MSMSKRLRMIAFALVAVIPAILSYALVSIARKRLRGRALNASGSGADILLAADEPRWQGWSELQDGKQNLLTSMIVCPRWNPHSVQHCVGPLAVQDGVLIDIDCAHRSAKLWILSIYRNGVEVETLSSANVERARGSMVDHDGHQRYRLPLAAGVYSIFVRYYQCRPDAACPSITVPGRMDLGDRDIVIESRDISFERVRYQAFLAEIQNRKGLVYFFLHPHVYVALMLRGLLPAGFVRRLYLPYGNPQTEFFYDLVDQGETVRLSIDEADLQSASVHIVFFNRCGFPVSWQDITEAAFIGPSAVEAGSYLVRIIR